MTATPNPQGDLRIVPVSFREAQAFIAAWHRHHKPPRGMKFCLGAADGDVLVGVATVGRPVARAFDNGKTLEVNRTCADGTPHVNSMLYGACWRAAKALGYERLITYTQEGESGASLRAAGWRIIAELPARGPWKYASQPRDPSTGGIQRTLWEAP